MRVIFTLSVFFLLNFSLFAQPANDDCGDATPLSLTTPPSCPSTATVTNSFSFDNIDATPITPYPVFTGCPSGSTSGPAAEVWFTFTATANQTTIDINGLTEPNVVIYQGANCVSLLALDCNSGAGSTSVTANTLIGLDYYILVSGVDVADQGTFDMDITSGNLCNSCAPPGAIELIPNPPPINGTYPSGQQVQICVNVNAWDGNAAGTIEWLHAVTFDFGPGWDPSTINPNPPGSCGGDGSWDWYDSWTGCNTGDTFGPGFAYDSSSGIGCGGSPNDGDPGNNWGDGQGNCANVPGGAPPFSFCFSIEVSDCPPNSTGEDIGIAVEIWSDGDSGSWTQTGCNSGQELDITSSVVCCNDDEPLINTIDLTCAGADDGAIEMEGNGGYDPSEVFNFYVFDENNNIVFECLGCSGLITTPNDLPAGSYTVTAINVATDCPRSTPPFEIFEPDQPQADAQVLNMPCPGDLATLEGSVDLGGATEIYNWTGPGGPYTGQTIDVAQAGTYTLIVEVDGCPSLPATVDVEFVDFSVLIFGEEEACFDTEFTLEASDGVAWDWVDLNTGNSIGSDQFLTTTLSNSTTIELTATDPNGCEAVATIDITVFDLPIIDIVMDGTGCSNAETILTASGAEPNGTYEWFDDAGADNPRFFNNPTPGFETYEVIGTDENGCQGIASIDVEFIPPPDIMLVASDDEVCAGEQVTVTAISSDPISAIDWHGAGPNNQNPITVTVNGNTTVEADVTSTDGCTTEGSVVTINVETPQDPPTISCGVSTATSVEFLWTDVAGAEEYEITINGGAPEIVLSPFYTATGFSSNTNVTITVQALGTNLCPVALATFTCSTLSCPPFMLSVDPVAPICLTGSTANIFLTHMAESNAGTISWEGAHIVNSVTGEFSPTMAGPGNHDVTVRYSDGTCEYTDTETIVINATPTSTFTLSTAGPVCVDSPVTVTYTGNASPSATYTWNFGNGVAVPGNGQGPHTVTWPTGGTKTVTLTVSENGCTSTESSQSLSVVAPIATPIVSCGTSTTSSVVFTWSPVAGATSYNVNVISGPPGVLAGETYTVTNLNAGQSVTISVTANTNNVCGPTTSAEVTCSANACPNFNINITPISDICLTGINTPITLQATASGGVGGGTFAWSGTAVTGNQFNPEFAGAGAHTITVIYTENNCMGTADIVVNVFDTPSSDFTIAPAAVCTGQDATVTYTGAATAAATYTWNFNGGVAVPGTGQGPHTVTWAVGGPKTVTLTVAENGCTSTSSSQNISVQEPMAAPVINCSPNTTQIVFSWNDIAGATGYQVNLISAPGGAMSVLDEPNRTYTVSGLMAGDNVEIEVIALGNGPCGNSSNTFMCQAQDCPAIMVDIDAVAPICLVPGTPAFNLTTTLTGGDGDGVYTWAGADITDSALGTFQPSTVGPSVVTVNYREDGCDYVDDITIQINPIPTADFTASSPICITANSNVIYTGSASAGATFDWNFDSGNAMPGTGAGPHTVNWATAGDKTITLTVTENGCVSDTFMQTVTVAPELIAPIIACDVTMDSIIFTWPDVAGASSYTVSIIDAPGNAFATGGDPARTFTMAGFTPGQTATIEVTAVSGTACPGITFQGTCALENCPNITVEITDVLPICLDATAAAFNLNAVITGNTNGVLTWTGTGITDQMNGTFDPTLTNAGNFTIVATYEETSCVYTDTTIITVNAQPSASFTATGPICEDDISTVTYTGGADPMADYNWNFSGGTIVSGADAGPYEISWVDGGNPTVSLTVTENNCASDPFSTTVEVIDSLQAPAINCATDNTSITFSWNAVVGATGYTVNVISAPAGAVETPDIPNRTYTFSNLTPEDQVTIEVVVLTDNICGGVSAMQTCASDACSERAFGPNGYGPFCEDDGIQMLSPVISGGNVTGAFSWAGDGIVSSTGMFDPAVANIGDNLVMLSYEQTGCFYDTIYTVVVNAKPTASFTVTTPICISDNSTITFTGTAGPSATYDWFFDGGTIVSGTGAGPYEINWSTAGDKNITLTVTDNGCSSEEAAESVTVEDIIPPVVISCSDETTGSVTFNWDAVAGADTYTVAVVQGPMGVQSGNTYTVNGLTDGEEVIIEVTASGSSICGSSIATGTCTALTCQPLMVSLDGPAVICENDDAAITITITGGQGTPVTLDYTVNGSTAQLNNVVDGDQILLSNLTVATNVVVTGVADEVNVNCLYNPNAEFDIAVDPMVSAGLDATLDPVCPDDATQVNLGDALSGADPGGSWAETSAVPSTGGAFQAGAGTFNAMGQASANYSFSYTVDGGACPDASAVISMTINMEPVADAGLDQSLTCNMGAVVLGGNSSAGATYEWVSDNPDAMISDPNSALIDVSAPGTYTLEVTNAEGCIATDAVFVSSDFDVPVADVSISEVSCFQANDGAIVINNVAGGTPPYAYSLNGGQPTSNPFFGNLTGAEYTLLITDANGCFTELAIMLIEPTEVAVELTTSLENNENVIDLGESITLQALYDPSIPIDTIIWRPDSIAVGAENAVEVSPTQTTTYSVTITDINGCSDSDNMTVIVQKTRPVFVPSAFSPDGDNFNDFLYPQGGDEIVEIKSFLVFNRWGEAVFENYEFQSNNPAEGWDGRFRGQIMNSAVFVYFMEVEFTDGEVVLFKGDVMLMR